MLHLLLNWLPLLVGAKGHGAADGASAALVFNVMAAVGAALLGLAADRAGVRRTTLVAYLVLAVSLWLLAASTALGPILATAGTAGFMAGRQPVRPLRPGPGALPCPGPLGRRGRVGGRRAAGIDPGALGRRQPAPGGMERGPGADRPGPCRPRGGRGGGNPDVPAPNQRSLSRIAVCKRCRCPVGTRSRINSSAILT